jgi:hypothetical protein
MLIPDPDFAHPGSRILDPKTAERGEKEFVVTNSTKLEIF